MRQHEAKLWIERYKSGEFEYVWNEMQALGERIRDPDVITHAEEVAHETMQRALQNVEIIIENLERIGFDFAHYTDGDEIGVPHRVAADHPDMMPVEEFEERHGVLPLSLKYWWKIVGHVQLMGAHPSGEIGLDALCVDGPDRGYIESQVEQRMQERSENPTEIGPIRLDLSPDHLHKDNISGGLPYSIRIPCYYADSTLFDERHNTTFVNWLRIAFRWGGFPGLERHANPPADLLEIRSKLHPI